MSCLNKSPEICSNPAFHVLVAGGGLQSSVAAQRDPFEALDDLMVVVEALCPEWVQKPTLSGTEVFRL